MKKNHDLMKGYNRIKCTLELKNLLQTTSEKLGLTPSELCRGIVFSKLKDILYDLSSDEKIIYTLEIKHGQERLIRTEDTEEIKNE